MHKFAKLPVLAIFLAAPAWAEPQPTDIPGVTAEIAFLRQYNGVLHLGILLRNAGEKDASLSQPVTYGDMVVIDAGANKKLFPLKDANGNFLAGPISDRNGGGRWYPKLPGHSSTIVWVLYNALASGDAVSVQGPVIHSFDNVAVTSQPPAPGQSVESSIPPLTAGVVSANRANGQLKVELRIANPGDKRIAPGNGRTVAYADVYALDPVGKRSYPLLKDEAGEFIATPVADKSQGGRWFLSKIGPNSQTPVDLTFQAPPDSVSTVDIVFPLFGPIENVAISGKAGAAASGIAVAGASSELQRALQDLNAQTTAQSVTIDLSADVLFDFNKWDLKPAAVPALEKLATVLKSYPAAQIAIEGYTDAIGNDAYNLALSQRRAETVKNWLITNAQVPGANLHTRGWGKAKPVAPNANPDGTDNPEGRAKNRRVEIVITKP